MKFIIYLSGLFLGYFLSAQNIKGSLLDEDNLPVSGANIYIENTLLGATTNQAGDFSFETENTKFPFVLVVEAKDFITQKITINSLSPFQIKLQKSAKETDLGEVIVKASGFRAGYNDKAVAFTSMDINTTPNALGEAIRAMQNVPGVQNVQEDGRLYIRGGTSNETKVFIDGLMVLSPYTSTADNNPVRGRFPADLFKGISLSTGGFPAEYGQALSGTLTMDSKKISEQETKIDLAFSSVGIWDSYTQKYKKDLFYVSGNYSNLSPYLEIFNSRMNWVKPYQQISSEAYYQHLFERGSLKYFASYANYNFSFYGNTADVPLPFKSKLNTNDFYHSLVFNYDLGNRYKLYIGTNFNYSDKNIDGASYSSDEFYTEEILSHSKIKLSKKLNSRIEINGGTEWIYNRYNQKYQDFSDSSIFYPHTDHSLFAGFLEANWAINSKLGISSGWRYENSSLLHKNTISPRISANYNINSHHSISALWGKYYQMPENTQLIYSSNLNFSYSDSYILNYSFNNSNTYFKTEIYYKKYHDLPTFTKNGYLLENLNNDGFGFAKGIDLFLKSKIGNIQYWLTYSFIDSERKFQDYPKETQPNFVANHNASFTGKYWWNAAKIMWGINLNFTSGRPYNNPNLEGFNQSKTKNYFNTSVSVSYLLKQNIVIYANVNNVLGTRNIFNYQYSNQPDSNGYYSQKEILPSTDRFYFLGIFITLSPSKKLNQLDKL